MAPGCSSCRGSGLHHRVPVYDFIDSARVTSMLAGRVGAATLRRDNVERGGRTLFLAGLDKASQGIVDVREPIRLLLHEC